MNGESTGIRRGPIVKRNRFSLQFFPIFVSLVLFSFVSLNIMLSAYADRMPFSIFVKPSSLDVYLGKSVTYIPYIELVTGFLAFAGGLLLITLWNKMNPRHKIVLAFGSILFALSILVLFLPDIGTTIFPSVRDHNLMQNFSYYRYFSLVVAIFLLLTVYLGSFLISVSSLKPIRVIFSSVALIIMAIVVLNLWPIIYYSGIPLYSPILNSSMILDLHYNYINFMSLFTVFNAELFFVSSLLISAAMFPVFRK